MLAYDRFTVDYALSTPKDLRWAVLHSPIGKWMLKRLNYVVRYHLKIQQRICFAWIACNIYQGGLQKSNLPIKLHSTDIYRSTILLEMLNSLFTTLAKDSCNDAMFDKANKLNEEKPFSVQLLHYVATDCLYRNGWITSNNFHAGLSGSKMVNLNNSRK